jgi:murein DD-endopeptidase MepM/ murein hydrolase activator NlpD
MSIRTARLRALHIVALALLGLVVFGTPAGADDGTTPPRAAPVARALPRTFASYDDLLKTAMAVAGDQAALYTRLQLARTEEDLARSILAAVSDPRIRGGLVHAETNVSDEPTLVALRQEIAAARANESQLIAAGASPYAPAPTWQRPLNGEVSQPFGPTGVWLEPARLYRGTYYWHFHDGVDILDPAGTAIVAPARGRVVFAGLMADGAEVLVLAHDDGLVSLYAHLQAGPLAPPVKAGDIVLAGERIGSVGLTGLTTGYHLHWAVYKNGEPIDPLSTLGG